MKKYLLLLLESRTSVPPVRSKNKKMSAPRKNSYVAVQTPVPPAISKSYWFNREEWWPCWLGFFAFIKIGVFVHWDIDIPEMQFWTTNPIDSLTHKSNYGLPYLFVFQLCALWVALKAVGAQGANLFPLGFFVVFFLAFVSKVLAKQEDLHSASMGDSIWAIFFGVIVTNVFYPTKTPAYLKIAQQTELYIATSLVLLFIDMKELAPLASHAFVVSWIDTPVIFVAMSIVGWKLFRFPLPDSIIVSGMTVVCGSSAAIALAAAMSLKKERTDLPIAISSLLTVPCIIVLPIIAHSLKMNATMAGAWFGGCVDSTGAVIATANVFGSKEVVSASAVIKMGQNILIAPFSVLLTAFAVRNQELLFAGELLRSDNYEGERSPMKHTWRDDVQLLWTRFPKFVIGFMVSALLYNTAIPTDNRKTVQDGAFIVSEWFSTFSFVSIGMSLRLRDLLKKVSVTIRLVLFYLVIQIIDIVATAGFAKAAFP
jgi:uncharacterized membrane protein YadS